MTDNFTIGAVFKTPFEADLKHEYTYIQNLFYLDSQGRDGSSLDSQTKDETMDMPMSYGIGFAYRFSDTFTASLDIYRTEWDDFILKNSDGIETSPVTGKSAEESDIDPTHQIRIGAEYLFITSKYIIPVCAGVFYDPGPAQGSPDNFFGLSIGSGIGWNKYNFDIAYQFRFGNDGGSSILKELDFSQDVEEHTLYCSVVVHF